MEKSIIENIANWYMPLDENNVEFISSIPSCDMNAVDYEHMFNGGNRGDLATRIFSQIAMLFSSLGSEGGLFLVIGRKK